MKQFLCYLLACSVVFTACKSNKTDSTETTIEKNMDEIKASTAEKGKAGKGKIHLQCKGKNYEISGVCGAVASMGTLTIAVPDDSIHTKIFTINFTTDKLPESTSTFTITKYDIEDKDASNVSISYTDMRSTQQMNWESNDKTGKLNFTVNGNEIKCNFSNLTLQPSLMYNKGEQDAPATVSGELTIYKN